MNGEKLPDLVAIMQRLLGPKGCPWDREQTRHTLRAYVLEEAYEVADAIDRQDPELLREELGDLLLQVVFQAELARHKGWFDLSQVIEGICHKLVRRHPHVFGDTPAESSQEALASWESVKAMEKAGSAQGRLDSIPQSMPALLRGFRIGEKAAAAGYDWLDASGARVKVNEELAELDEAVTSQDAGAIEEELGDVLFALASVARKHSIDPESALRGTLRRFQERFVRVEERARLECRELSSLTEQERDAWWQDAKRLS